MSKWIGAACAAVLAAVCCQPLEARPLRVASPTTAEPVGVDGRYRVAPAPGRIGPVAVQITLYRIRKAQARPARKATRPAVARPRAALPLGDVAGRDIEPAGAPVTLLEGFAAEIQAALTPRTAIYDISAGVVILPNGERLEAHSGLGRYRDDAKYTGLKNVGPTPPNVYHLAALPRLFYGVRALRMTPADEKKMKGRNGILAHSYLHGPSGQSQGCVAVKNYLRFLQAFLKGEIDRVLVVASLGPQIKPAPAAAAQPQRIRSRMARYYANAVRPIYYRTHYATAN